MSNSNCSCYGELNLFYLRRTQLFLFTSNSTFILYIKLKVFLYVELNSFWLRQTQFVLDTSSSTLQQVYSILQQVSSTPLVSLLNSAATVLNSVSRSHFCRLSSWKVPSVAPSIFAYSMKSSVILYSAPFSRTSLYPVSKVYTTLSTLDSALLSNSGILLHILIMWLRTYHWHITMVRVSHINSQNTACKPNYNAIVTHLNIFPTTTQRTQKRKQAGYSRRVVCTKFNIQWKGQVK